MKTNVTKTNIYTDTKEVSFANRINIYKLFWIFYIGSFAGVIVETIWCRVTNGFFENRTALILEPLNPIYGLGAVFLLLLTRFKKKNTIFLFILCMIIGGTFEWLCSFFQEIIYGTVSWKYYSDTFGIFERTSLVYSVFWGILGIVYIRFFYPFISTKIECIPNKTGKILTIFLSILILFDIVFSSCAVLRGQERLKQIPANNVIREFYDKHFDDLKLKKIYPHMTSVI